MLQKFKDVVRDIINYQNVLDVWNNNVYEPLICAKNNTAQQTGDIIQYLQDQFFPFFDQEQYIYYLHNVDHISPKPCESIEEFAQRFSAERWNDIHKKNNLDTNNLDSNKETNLIEKEYQNDILVINNDSDLI